MIQMLTTVICLIITMLFFLIIYIDNKMFEAQDKCIHELNDCMCDQTNEIRALWTMCDYFAGKIKETSNDNDGSANDKQ